MPNSKERGQCCQKRQTLGGGLPFPLLGIMCLPSPKYRGLENKQHLCLIRKSGSEGQVIPESLWVQAFIHLLTECLQMLVLSTWAGK